MMVSPFALLGVAALAVAFAGGYHVASTSSDAARLASENAALVDMIGTMANRLTVANAAAEADTARAQSDAARLAELQEIIDGIEADDRVCLDRDSDAHRRLRLIR
jgi:type II secretory pathway component PulJ